MKKDRNTILSVQYDPAVVSEIEKLVTVLKKRATHPGNKVSKSKLLRCLMNLGLEQAREMDIEELADYVRE